MLNQRSWGPLCWVLAFFTHLISIFSGPQLIRAQMAPSAWCGFPYHNSSPTVCISLELELYCNSPSNSNSTGRNWTQLSYIIVRRLLDLWNRMFNRHQAEITVMQFRGHSLPVHQSMSVPWEFFSSSHFISQFPPTRFPLITAIRMCHLLLVHHLGKAFLAGSKGQNITQLDFIICVNFIKTQNKSFETFLWEYFCWQKGDCFFFLSRKQKFIPKYFNLNLIFLEIIKDALVTHIWQQQI